MTTADKWLQGLRIAGAATNLVGGVGDLVYPGGIAGAIDESFGGPEAGEDFERQRAAAAKRMVARSSAAAGVRPQSPEAAARPAQRAPQAARPRPARRVTVDKFPGFGTQAHKDLDKTVGLPRVEREKQPPHPVIDQRYEYALPAAAPAPSSPAPTKENPIHRTWSEFEQAAIAAEKAGNAEEFGRYSEMALLEGIMQIEDLPREVKLYLERIETDQKKRVLVLKGARERGITAADFNEIRPAIVASRDRIEVEELLRLATETQGTAQGVRAFRGDVKNPEMTKIEQAAAARLAQLDAAGFPGVDADRLALLGGRAARREWWETGNKKRQAKAGGGGPRATRFRWEPLEKQFNAIKIPGQKYDNESIRGLDDKIAQLATRLMPAAESALRTDSPEATLRDLKAKGVQAAISNARKQVEEARAAVQAGLSSRTPFLREPQQIGFGITIGQLGEKGKALTGGDGHAIATRAAREVKRADTALRKVDAKKIRSGIEALIGLVSKRSRAQASLASSGWASQPELKGERDAIVRELSGYRRGNKGAIDEDVWQSLKEKIDVFDALVRERLYSE